MKTPDGRRIVSPRPSPTAARGGGWWTRPVPLALIVAALVGLVFLRVCGQDFVAWDDNLQVYANPYLYPITAANLASYWLHTFQRMYIPVSYMTWAVLATQARLPPGTPPFSETGTPYDPHVFHMMNLALHCANTVLVLFLLIRLTQKPLPAALGAALFGLHPVQVESVAWVAEMRGLLSATFFLGAVLAHLWAGEGPERPSRKYYLREALGLFLGLMALLSKPSAVVLPAVLLVLDLGLLHRDWRQAGCIAVVYALAAVPVMLVTQHIQPASLVAHTALWTRSFIVGDTLAFYLAKLVWPVSYSIDYGRTPVFVMAHGWAYLEWLAPAAVALAVWSLRRRFPVLVPGALIALLVIAPVSGIIPFAFQRYSTVADRYLYLALLGPALILAGLLPERPRPAAVAAVALALLPLTTVTFLRVPIWDDTTSLMTASIQTSPRSWVAHNNLGLALMREGRWDAAMSQLQIAAACDPASGITHDNIGEVLRRQGQSEAALTEFRAASRLSPDWIKGDIDLGDTLLSLGRPQEADAAYAVAMSKNPEDPIPYYNTANIALHAHDYAAAEAGFRKATLLDSRDSLAQFHLGEALAAQGRYSQARAAFTQAVNLGDMSPAVQAALAHLPPL